MFFSGIEFGKQHGQQVAWRGSYQLIHLPNAERKTLIQVIFEARGEASSYERAGVADLAADGTLTNRFQRSPSVFEVTKEIFDYAEELLRELMFKNEPI